MGPSQANARRPKRSKFSFGTSRDNPPAERSERGGVCWSSSAARYSGEPSYEALCTSTSSLNSVRQCNCRNIVVMDCRSPRRICMTVWSRIPLYHFQTIAYANNYRTVAMSQVQTTFAGVCSVHGVEGRTANSTRSIHRRQPIDWPMSLCVRTSAVYALCCSMYAL